MSVLRYLAYGSNMHLARMCERVPSAKPIRVVRLAGWALRFHKRGKDGSAKCNVVQTDRSEDRVHGVLYEMEDDEKASLDGAEGLGRGYRERSVELADASSAFLYVAASEYIDDGLKPFVWYKRFVVEAARFHEFPEDYIRQLERVEAIVDPDEARSRKNLRVLGRSKRL